jgi:hypothetical protein
MTVYDSYGGILERLIDEEKLPGTYQVIWDAGGVPRGCYSCLMEATGFADRKEMVLTR